jgi:uncharacterized protein (UPF0261 family)
MAGKVVILGTLDTKGQEFKYIKELIESTGAATIVINAGVKGQPYFDPDISNIEVARAGGRELEELIARDDRGLAVDIMMRGSVSIVADLYRQGQAAGLSAWGERQAQQLELPLCRACRSACLKSWFRR